MRRTFAVLVLSLSIVPLLALDDLSASPPGKWEKEPTTYRDFPFGGSIKEFEKTFHTKVDSAHACNDVGGQAPAGVTECVGRRLPGWTGSLGIPQPEVGFDVNEYFMFDETGVFVRATWSLDAANFDKAVRFLVSKYGSPSATRKFSKTGSGDDYLWWYGEKVNFFAQRDPSSDPTSLILFETRAFTEELAANTREQREKAKKAF